MTPFVDLVHLPSEITPGSLTGRVAVVVDVLRASSTIITALDAGASWIKPVAHVKEARSEAESLGGDVLLVGERGGLPPAGFDMGNSPSEFSSDRVLGRGVVMTTTNGTGALLRCHDAKTIWVGGALNGSAVAAKAISIGGPVTIVCAGANSEFSADDVAAAGAIIDSLRKAGGDVSLSDTALAAMRLFLSHADSLADFFGECSHGRRLKEIGLEMDLKICAALNTTGVVPILSGDRLVSG